jgi:transcription factor IIIB subunit 2
MDQIAKQLNIGTEIRDMAHNYHKLAVAKKNVINFKSLTQGRDHKVVAAACLYMACRIHNSPHLLIDLADAI